MNISSLSLENAHLFLEAFEDQIKPKAEVQEYNADECQECRGKLIFINFFLTCSNCGLTDLDKCERSYLDDSETFIRKRSFYKRKLYATEKLKLMTCRKPCKKANYVASIKILAKKKFETIFELKKLMKDLKMNKLYPYIYQLYNDIKQINLVPLTFNDIEKLTHRFRFNQNKIKKFSYFLIINRMLKKHNYNFYNQITIPESNKKLVLKIDNILSQYNI